MAPATPIGSDVATFRFSSEEFSQRERLTAWREIFGRTVCSLDIEPLSADRFRSEATIHARPGLGVLAGSSSGVHLSHSKDLIVDDDLSFMTGSMLKWTAFQRGRNPVLGPGDGVLMSNADVGSMSLPDTARFITFKVPVKAIAPLVPDIGALIARRVPHDCQPLRLLVRYLGALQEEGAAERGAAEPRRQSCLRSFCPGVGRDARGRRDSQRPRRACRAPARDQGRSRRKPSAP
jgi:AraC-binding-like domain